MKRRINIFKHYLLMAINVRISLKARLTFKTCVLVSNKAFAVTLK